MSANAGTPPPSASLSGDRSTVANIERRNAAPDSPRLSAGKPWRTSERGNRSPPSEAATISRNRRFGNCRQAVRRSTVRRKRATVRAACQSIRQAVATMCRAGSVRPVSGSTVGRKFAAPPEANAAGFATMATSNAATIERRNRWPRPASDDSGGQAVATVRPLAGSVRPVSGSTVGRKFAAPPEANAAGFATIEHAAGFRQAVRPVSDSGDRVPRPACQRARIRRRIPATSNAATVGRKCAAPPVSLSGKDSGNRPPVATIGKPSGFRSNAATVRPLAAPPSASDDSGNRSTVPEASAPVSGSEVATIERGQAVATVCRRIPANIAGFFPPCAQPLAVRLAIAATVRVSPAYFRRKHAATARRCVRPRRTGSRPSRLAAPLQGRLTPLETRARIPANVSERRKRATVRHHRQAVPPFDRAPRPASDDSGDRQPTGGAGSEYNAANKSPPAPCVSNFPKSSKRQDLRNHGLLHHRASRFNSSFGIMELSDNERNGITNGTILGSNSVSFAMRYFALSIPSFVANT